MITEKKFGTTKDGREVLAFTLKDGADSATVLDLGGTLQSIVVPDKNGTPTDVICGYGTVAEYENNGGYLGALIGRFGNRIGEGKFTLEGKEYRLYCNDRGNHLHGGKEGFDKKIWAHKIEGDQLVLSILSPDGEEGYPGNLNVEVRYSFLGGKLRIEYRAWADQTTLCNLTNHAYFNLNGEGDGSILDNELWIDCDYITPTIPTMIPEGGFRAVKGTPFDFNVPKEIGRDIGADDVDLKQGGGYDHCHVLKNKCGEFVKYAVVKSRKTGISMTCYTDMPAVQLYTGNGMNMQGKTARYGGNAAFCLETQAIPNNVNVPEYAEKGSSVLAKGTVYSFCAVYEFTA
ncbi:MAG: galactose mutarotase [Clostridia bacterium]|nr:galactose mutarotase [Clostridia bacterium]